MIPEDQSELEELEIRVAEREHALQASSATRKLNRLQGMETERNPFMQSACRALVETGPYSRRSDHLG
jgi:hypothetical protein